VHKRLRSQIEQTRSASGEVELEALFAEISAAYELDERRHRLDRRLLKRQAELFETALENMTHGFSMYDRKGRLVACNRQFLEIYRLPAELGRRGTPFRRILEGRVNSGTYEGEDGEDYVRRRLGIIGGDRPISNVSRVNTGQVITITHRPMPDGGWVSTHRDITEMHAMQAELTHLAYHDPLTELPNRNFLYQKLEQAFATIDMSGGFGMLCLDLDGFKLVNDTLGHSAGDRLLREIAARLRATIGPDDAMGRMGGDEFALVTPTRSRAAVEALARELREAVRPPVEIDGQQVAVALSVGTALAPQDGTNPDALLKSADLALYAAKRDGRGAIRAFEPAMDRAERDRRQLEHDLRRALENGEFSLNYQPIISLRTQRFTGFEALLRWQHPERGAVSPAEFIPVAEEMGLVVQIGDWVIREALAEAAAWPDELRIAVNVSSAQFGRGNVVSTLIHALAQTQIAPERVEIEITESVFLEKDDANLEALRQLHALGLKVAMDDFGTGYSALSYLLSFPFDKIKIDGSFVRALDHAGAAHAIVRSIADIGYRMGLVTTAEGVETPEQLRNVYDLGYSEAQGYLIARPMSGVAVRRLLNRQYDEMPEEPFASVA
jgi:diguanylate cyclase (GGDEF)-like protein